MKNLTKKFLRLNGCHILHAMCCRNVEVNANCSASRKHEAMKLKRKEEQTDRQRPTEKRKSIRHPLQLTLNQVLRTSDIVFRCMFRYVCECVCCICAKCHWLLLVHCTNDPDTAVDMMMLDDDVNQSNESSVSIRL